MTGLPAMPAGGGRTGGRGGGGGRGGSAPNEVERVTAQRATAVQQVGEESADDLMSIWNSVLDSQTRLSALDFGAMLRFGHVLTRWINRPMVLFPSELKPEEKDILEDLILAAHTDAKNKSEAMMAEEMKSVTGGLPLPPGFKLPF